MFSKVGSEVLVCFKWLKAAGVLEVMARALLEALSKALEGVAAGPARATRVGETVGALQALAGGERKTRRRYVER